MKQTDWIFNDILARDTYYKIVIWYLIVSSDSDKFHLKTNT